MDEHVAQPAGAFDAKEPREPESGDGKETKDIPIGKSTMESDTPTDRIANLGAGEIELRGESQGDDGPERPNEEPVPSF